MSVGVRIMPTLITAWRMTGDPPGSARAPTHHTAQQGDPVEGDAMATSSTGDLRPRRYLTVADICDELDLPRSTFYDWRSKRRAPRCLKLPNGEIRVKRVDFDAWLESHVERRP